ncbi:sensor domain-containing diguanylate cyclase [Henriciella sp.]|uniref:sensor domain-containing diguanylate cyclase n=1 Tax=Henriciella sp. TaxID=1968823 RepID=UPI0026158A28|nr:sensor domain-containing diguanylate cyclase [Henriciella sp.]
MAVDLARTAEGGSRSEYQEARRLEAVHTLDILDTPNEEPYDRIVRLVRAIFRVDIAFIAIIDAHRQWYKAISGMEGEEAPLNETFCLHTLNKNEMMVIPDASKDPVFSNNPFVAGKTNIRFYAGVPLKTRKGFAVGTLCAIDRKPRAFSDEDVQVLQDLADIVVDQMELRIRARTDELTGILSRGAFQHESERIAALAQRHRHDLSAICFDLDHFKQVNDTLGHAAGDQVLKAVVKAVTPRMRKSDLFARVGGEEFTILLPETGRQGAMEVAEKLRRDIASLRLEFNGKPMRVTASFGIAGFAVAANDLETLLANADAALYRAKHAGRNRCEAWGGEKIPVKAARRRVLKTGKISFNYGSSSIDCTVRTLGEQGAGLSLISTVDVPNEFRLLIPSDGFDASCKVTSRTRTHLEVEFR